LAVVLDSAGTRRAPPRTTDLRGPAEGRVPRPRALRAAPPPRSCGCRTRPAVGGASATAGRAASSAADGPRAGTSRRGGEQEGPPRLAVRPSHRASVAGRPPCRWHAVPRHRRRPRRHRYGRADHRPTWFLHARTVGVRLAHDPAGGTASDGSAVLVDRAVRGHLPRPWKADHAAGRREKRPEASTNPVQSCAVPRRRGDEPREQPDPPAELARPPQLVVAHRPCSCPASHPDSSRVVVRRPPQPPRKPGRSHASSRPRSPGSSHTSSRGVPDRSPPLR
jgi:hypothetical protein